MKIYLPQYHAGQLAIIKERKRFNVIQCGRRFGKTTMGVVLASEMCLAGQPVGWFAPTYKYLMEVWREHIKIFTPIIAKSNESEKRIELVNGASLDYWTMDSDDPARGRKYKRVVLDECGIVRNLEAVWNSAIRPTLTDLKGDAWLLGTPKGRQEFHRFYVRGEQGDKGWASFRAPTRTNPAIDPEELEDAKRQMPPQIFAQEFEGIPADDGGNPFGMAAIASCVGECTGDPVCFGVDLAKSTDWTWVVGLSQAGHVVVSERWQSPWRETKMRVASIIGDKPTAIDSTGVGDPIVEELQRDLSNVEGVKFSSTSKQQMMELLAARIQTGEVRFSDQRLRTELESFEYEYKQGGRVFYSAPSGLHDDGVCALALASRKLETRRHGPDFYFGVADGRVLQPAGPITPQEARRNEIELDQRLWSVEGADW